MLITNDNAASAPHIMKLAYDYTKELVPVIYLARQPQMLAAHPSLGVNSVAELVDYVKANPGLGYATSGVGTNQHILGEWFKQETGLKLDHVPYRGAGQAINDLIAGHVKIAFLGPTAHGAALPGRQPAPAGAVVGQARADLAGDSDARGGRLQGPGARGLVRGVRAEGHAAGDRRAAQRRDDKALADPAMQENFTSGAIEPVGGTRGRARQARAQADSEKYERLVKELNIKTN